MIKNSSSCSAGKYYLSTSNSAAIDWTLQLYLTEYTNYTIPSDEVYLFLYLDPYKYPVSNNITLRNSNPYLYQSLKINFIVNINGD